MTENQNQSQNHDHNNNHQKQAHNRVALRYKPRLYTLQELLMPITVPSIHLAPIAPISNVPFYLSEDHPYNKRGFKYVVCHPNPILPSLKFSASDFAPYVARADLMDRSARLFINDDYTTVTTEKGFRSVRANVGVSEGKWYLEFKIINANSNSIANTPDNGHDISPSPSLEASSPIPQFGSRSRSHTGTPPQIDSTTNRDGHVRIGVARREASIEAPVGYDAYGYGLRDATGQKVHLSRPVEFMEPFKSGDTLGLLISLPSVDDQRRWIREKHPEIKLEDQIDVFRERIPISYKGNLYFEQLEYMPPKEMDNLIYAMPSSNKKQKTDHANKVFKPDTIPSSYIKIYKNGKFMGTPFTDLTAFLPPYSKPLPSLAKINPTLNSAKKYTFDDGTLGYYPMISCYRGGVAKFNMGPDFEAVDMNNDLTNEMALNDPLCDENIALGLKNKTIRPFCERYDEMIAEDVTWDIIAEIESTEFDKIEAALLS